MKVKNKDRKWVTRLVKTGKNWLKTNDESNDLQNDKRYALEFCGKGYIGYIETKLFSWFLKRHHEDLKITIR